jgi:hypothetical protein
VNLYSSSCEREQCPQSHKVTDGNAVLFGIYECVLIHKEEENKVQNYWVSGLWPSSSDTTFQKLDLFPFTGEGRKIPTLLRLL